MTRSIGIDLHKTKFSVCFLTASSSRYKEYMMFELANFIKELDSSDKVALEATGNSRYFSEQLRQHVSEVVIVNPKQFRIISDSVQKTDKKDAEQLALFLSKGMLPTVRNQDELSLQIKSLVHTRDRLVKLRTSLKNKIHNILNAHGIVSKRASLSSKKGLAKILKSDVPEIACLELEVIVSQIEHLNSGISKLDKEIENQGSKLKGFANITSIKGIGSKSGSILLSVIGNIDDFPSRKQLDSYFGIVPRISISNERVHYGRITKQGNKLGRTTLVQCTLIAIRYSDYLNSYYQRLKIKKGSGKAIITTSRKLLVPNK
jgi:transposase